MQLRVQRELTPECGGKGQLSRLMRYRGELIDTYCPRNSRPDIRKRMSSVANYYIVQRMTSQIRIYFSDSFVALITVEYNPDGELLSR